MKPVDAVAPSSETSTAATAFRFGRTVETRTSPDWTSCRALLGASLPRTRTASVIDLLALSTAPRSTYKNSLSGCAAGFRVHAFGDVPDCDDHDNIAFSSAKPAAMSPSSSSISAMISSGGRCSTSS